MGMPLDMMMMIMIMTATDKEGGATPSPERADGRKMAIRLQQTETTSFTA